MADSLTISTCFGPVRGLQGDGYRQWLGVPFAIAERFAAPCSPAVWTDVHDASVAGPSCPQAFGKKAMIDPPGHGEDCLNLNITVPDGGDDAGQKPVYVWIHGGAFMAGSGSSYNGAMMATLGDVIVVTINYRVGFLGFLNLGEAAPSNLGMRDQIAALQWVRDNIAAFGGDPARVTIGGQSAGAMSVSMLMLCERAWPLFHGAIVQSGAVSLLHDRERSVGAARLFLDQLGMDGDAPDLERLRALPLSPMFAAQAAVAQAMPRTIATSPWFDGDLLPGDWDSAHTAPTAPVPMIAGAAAEEIRLFDLMPGGEILPSSWDSLEAILHRQLGAERAGAILDAYPRTKAGRRALASDMSFAMPTRHFAERHAAANPTWYYRFDYSHPVAGATHGLDLTLTWPMHGLRAALARGGRMTGRRAALGQAMVRHYAHFVRHGRPQEGWPAYAPPTERPVMLFNLASGVAENPDAARLQAWGGHNAGPGLSSAIL